MEKKTCVEFKTCKIKDKAMISCQHKQSIAIIRQNLYNKIKHA